MIINWIIASAAIGAFSYMVVYFGKYNKIKSEYDKRCKELTNALGEVGRVKLRNNSLTEENNYLNNRIREYEHLMTAGYLNLKVEEYKLPDWPQCPKYSIVVVGQDTMNHDLGFVIKAFAADNEEDREFAIREAEELIETIQKA